MDYDYVEQIEVVQHDGRNYIQINNDAVVEVPEEVESWVAVDTIKFYAAYCGFLTYAQVNQQESLTDAVLRYTGITIDQLESGIEFSSEEAEVYAVLPASPGVVYCYNCGAANEQGAKFCMECGTEL